MQRNGTNENGPGQDPRQGSRRTPGAVLLSAVLVCAVVAVAAATVVPDHSDRQGTALGRRHHTNARNGTPCGRVRALPQHALGRRHPRALCAHRPERQLAVRRLPHPGLEGRELRRPGQLHGVGARVEPAHGLARPVAEGPDGAQRRGQVRELPRPARRDRWHRAHPLARDRARGGRVPDLPRRGAGDLERPHADHEGVPPPDDGLLGPPRGTARVAGLGLRNDAGQPPPLRVRGLPQSAPRALGRGIPESEPALEHAARRQPGGAAQRPRGRPAGVHVRRGRGHADRSARPSRSCASSATRRGPRSPPARPTCRSCSTRRTRRSTRSRRPAGTRRSILARSPRDGAPCRGRAAATATATTSAARPRRTDRTTGSSSSGPIRRRPRCA